MEVGSDGGPGPDDSGNDGSGDLPGHILTLLDATQPPGKFAATARASQVLDVRLHVADVGWLTPPLSGQEARCVWPRMSG